MIRILPGWTVVVPGIEELMLLSGSDKNAAFGSGYLGRREKILRNFVRKREEKKEKRGKF